MKFNVDMVYMGSIKKTYEDKTYYKGVFYDKDTGENYDFYLTEEFKTYLESFEIFSTHDLELQIYKRFLENGKTLNSIRLLNIDNVC